MSESRESLGDARTVIGQPDPTAEESEIGLAETAVPSDSEIIRSTRALPEGTVLASRYKIIRAIGSGGMGSVYLAEHTAIKKHVAVKVAGVNFANESELLRRFLQEARTASAVRHPNVVDITDFGHTEAGVPFFTMEYLEGEDLSETIAREGALPWPRVRRIMIQLLDALAAAHDQDIIHRDMKPGNCFRVTRDREEDFIKVVDFGLAKVLSEHLDQDNMTRSGVVLGTARYMAPEQALSLDIDHRVDLYAAGCIMFELLTGRTPFDANGFMGMLHKHIYEPPPSLRKVAPEAGISPDVDFVVSRAIAKKPDDRYQSAREFADAVRSLDERHGRSVAFRRRRRRRRLLAAAGVLVGLGGGAVAVNAISEELDRRATERAAVQAAYEQELQDAATKAAIEAEAAKAAVEANAAKTAAAAEAEAEAAKADETAPVTAAADVDATSSGGDGDTPADPDDEASAKTSAPRPKARSPRKKKTKKADSPTTTKVPDALSSSKVTSVLDSKLGGKVSACVKKHGGFSGERFPVSFSVAADGTPSAVKVKSMGSSPLGRCLKSAVAKITFPAAKTGGSFDYTIVLP